MAKIIPGITKGATPGERRFGQRLESLLEDDYLCWYNVPVGNRYQHPDFIVLHPRRGLLVLEVKDWKLENIQSINRDAVSLVTLGGIKQTANPLPQARQYAFAIKQVLENDPALRAPKGHSHEGKLLFPYGFGVVLTEITRKQFESKDLGQVCPTVTIGYELKGFAGRHSNAGGLSL